MILSTMICSCEDPGVVRGAAGDSEVSINHDAHLDVGRSSADDVSTSLVDMGGDRQLDQNSTLSPSLEDLSILADFHASDLISDQGLANDASTCETVTDVEYIYLEPREEQETLYSCHTPRWAMGLARGSRWRFEVVLTGDFDPEIHRWSRLTMSAPTSLGDPLTISSTALTLSPYTVPSTTDTSGQAMRSPRATPACDDVGVMHRNEPVLCG